MTRAIFSLLLSLLAISIAAGGAAGQADALGGGGGNPFGGGNPLGSFGAQPAEVTVTAEVSQDRVAPGGRFVIGVILDHAEGYHSWPSEAQDVLPPEIAEFALRTSVDALLEDGSPFVIGSKHWPPPHPAMVPSITGDPEPVEVMAYDGRAPVYLPVFVSESAEPGTYTIPIEAFYQACTDTHCLAPETVELEVEITIEPGAEEVDVLGVFADFDMRHLELGPPSLDAAAASATGEPDVVQGDAPGSASQFFGIELGGGIIVLALAAAVGGFILNLTPCVLPVIPIKVMTISQHAGTPGKSLMLGIWMALGVIGFWVALGLPVALYAGFGDPSRVFGIWWVSAGLGLFMAAMSLGLMGLFTITLPQRVYMVNPKADSAHGSFLFGVMTAVFGLPCFGFVIGPLLGGTAAQPPLQILTIFAALGFGMASPYLILSAKPSWVDKIPRTGPASELVKQVMGLLMFGAGAFFLGAGLIALVAEEPYLGKLLHFWAVAFFLGLAGLWLVYRTFQITKKPSKRVVFSLVAIAIAGAGIGVAGDATATARMAYLEKQAALEAAGGDGGADVLLTSVWMDYTPARHQRALDEGYTVVLDFTAEWCLNCKALKAAVLNKEPVKGTLRSDSIVSMTVDLTSRKAPGWDLLEELGQTGIPLLVVESREGGRWLSNAYTPGDVLSALEEHQGSMTAAR